MSQESSSQPPGPTSTENPPDTKLPPVNSTLGASPGTVPAGAELGTVAKKSKKKNKKAKKHNTQGPDANTDAEDGVHLALAIFYADVMKKRKNNNNGRHNNDHPNNGQHNNGQHNDGKHNNAPPHVTHPKEHKASKDDRMEREIENLRHLIMAFKTDDKTALVNAKLTLKNDSEGFTKRREIQTGVQPQKRNAHKFRIENGTHDLRSMVEAQDRGVKSETDVLELTLKNSILEFGKYTAENVAKKAEDDVKRQHTNRDVPTNKSEKILISIESELNNVRLALLSYYSPDKVDYELNVERVEKDSGFYNARKVDSENKQKLEMKRGEGALASAMLLSDAHEDAYTSDEDSDCSDASSCDN